MLIKDANNSNFKDTIKLLEENIYENKKNKIDKKAYTKIYELDKTYSSS